MKAALYAGLTGTLGILFAFAIIDFSGWDVFDVSPEEVAEADDDVVDEGDKGEEEAKAPKLQAKAWMVGESRTFLVQVDGSTATWKEDAWVAGDTRVCGTPPSSAELKEAKAVSSAKAATFEVEVCPPPESKKG